MHLALSADRTLLIALFLLTVALLARDGLRTFTFRILHALHPFEDFLCFLWGMGMLCAYMIENEDVVGCL
jgi:hypothetical protein